MPCLYLFSYVIPLSAFLGTKLGNIFSFSTLLLFVVIPQLEKFLNFGSIQLYKINNPSQKNRVWFTAILLADVPLHVCLILWGAWTWTQPLPALSKVGSLVSIGICSGVMGINIAHELIHRQSKILRSIGVLLLGFVFYSHWYLAHRLCHHVNVGTPKDSSTAALNENVYNFATRSILGSILFVFNFEKKRLRSQRFPMLHNRLFLSFLFSSTIALTLRCAIGPAACLFFILQSFFAVFILEATNYVQHYGLQRKETLNRFENISSRHSWGSNHLLSSLLFFRLIDHAEHHRNSSLQYQVLRDNVESPRFPYCISTMVGMAMIPPLWFKTMNPRVEVFSSRVR